MNHSEIVSFLWGVADLIRDTFKRGKYQDVILPLTVLRRLDCVLADTKEAVLKRQAQLKGKGLEDLDAQLRRASGFAFYNTSRYDFEKLLADAPHLAANLRNYIAGFSPNMREVLEKFDFDNTISKLDEAGLLFQVLERFKNVDLHPERIDNPTMGTIFEELIRKFNEALNENPGEHFTPRDVVHLMVDLMLAGDEDRIRRKGIVCTVYDPCCGSGGMLMITKEHVTVGWRRNGEIIRDPINPQAEIHLFGQEVNPETWAVSKSDLFMKDPTGRDADNIAFGCADAHPTDIERAARDAQAHDFITAFKDGYATEVGERGVTLSGGQRQRIAIARAFLTQPRILILDDSTSAIDSATEDQIQRAMRRISRQQTTFLITHRLSQIRWADRILVLRRGRLVAQGTHEELLASSEDYRRIFSRYD